MSVLHLSLFGPFQLTVDGEPITAPLWVKTQALLAYLVVEADRPHRRDFLAGLFWPDQPEDLARNSLRQALHQLQRAISRRFLATTAQTVHFKPDSDYALDTAEFKALVQRCHQHDHRRRETCRLCIERLERALALYRGDFLSQFFLKDSAAFEEWAMISREQLRQMAFSALSDLVCYQARRGAFVAMAKAAQRQLDLDPFDETAQRSLMQALTWQGRRNAALTQYETFCHLMEAELGAPPEAATVEVADQIRQETLPPAAGPRISNFPPRLTSFIGRGDDLEHLSELLQASQTRLVTLLGPGGVGKTRLAQEAAVQEAFAFTNGACFVSLAPLTHSDYVAPAIAEALDLTFSGATDPQTQLLGYLRHQSLLLVLDNVEHLPEVASLVSQILVEAPQVIILTTSRMALKLYGEHLVPVQPLPAVPAMTLFSARARTIQPAFTLTETNRSQVEAICARLDRLPLAIELASARIRHFSLPNLIVRLENRLATLSGGLHNLPARHQTLRSTIEWSYDLLTPAEQNAFAGLAVFSDRFTMAAALAVLNDEETIIQNLIDASLVQWGGDDTYSMLETLREFALECLDAAGLTEQTHQRHTLYYLQMAEEAELKLERSSRLTVLRQLEVALDNLRAALAWVSTTKPNSNLALRLGSALGEFWFYQGLFIEGQYWLEAALALPGDESRLRARALAHLGRLLNALDKYQQARQCYEEALAAFRSLDDQPNIAWTLLLMTHLALLEGRFEQATISGGKSLRLYRALGDDLYIAQVSQMLGTAALEQRDYDQALPLLQESQVILRRRQAYGDLASVLNLIGQIELDLGRVKQSLALFEESFAILQSIGQKHGLAWTLRNLGLASLTIDKTDASDYFRQSLQLYQELESQGGIAIALEGLAGVAAGQNQPHLSARLMGAAAAIRAKIGMPISPSSHSIYEQMLSTAKAQVTVTEWEAGVNIGRTCSFDPLQFVDQIE